MSVRKVVKAINKYSSFLVTSHLDAEGDALGSELALASLLRKMGKRVCIVNNEKPSANYNFLSGIDKIRTKLKANTYDATLIVDCPSKKRIGTTLTLLKDVTRIINIDHHIDNQMFGEINWVDPEASCVGEMIYELFSLVDVKLDKKDALPIYIAMLTDTGSFRHANTTSKTLRIASELLKFGIKPAKAYSRIYEKNSAKDVSLGCAIISNLCFSANNQIAWAKIDQGTIRALNSKHEILDKVLDFAKSVSSVKVVAVFSQLSKNFIKVSLRSKAPVNIQKVALVFGGGGHKLASGCVIKTNIEEAEKMLIKEIKKVLR